MSNEQKCLKVFKAIGSRIKARRKDLGMTQSQLAILIDCDKRYFQKIESGKASITVTTLQKISVALKVSLEFLVRAED